MYIKIVSVGKHNDNFTRLIEEYLTRLARAVKTDWQHVAPSGKPESEARKQESTEILGKIKPSSVVWLLDEIGEQMSSPALASKINVMQYQGVQELVIVVGGAYGVSDELKNRANFVWSLSKMVFPHRLAQLMLVEQLYRATEINRGSGYHHV